MQSEPCRKLCRLQGYTEVAMSEADQLNEAVRSKFHSNRGELAIIDRIRKSAWKKRSAKRFPNTLHIGIGDDAAIWQPRTGYEAILTCDWFLEGRHFLPDRH